MSPTLHLDTDAVRSLTAQMKTVCDEFTNQSNSLQTNASGMNWTSPGRAAFDDEFTAVCQQLNSQASLLEELARRVERATQQWETAAESIMQSSVGGQPGGGQEDSSAGSGSWNGAIDEVDPDGKLKAKPSVMEVIHGIYDIIEETMGELFAKSFLAQWIKGIGFIPDSIELMTSSQSVQETSQQWSQAVNQYGSNSPQATQAREAYSSAELSQILTPWGSSIIKSGGKWEELVQLYEDFKYEGKGPATGVQ